MRSLPRYLANNEVSHSHIPRLIDAPLQSIHFYSLYGVAFAIHFMDVGLRVLAQRHA
jgi:hypothetical protein